MRKRFSFSLIAGIVLTGLIVLLSLISVFYTPYDGEAMDLMNRFSLPSAEHLLGTDHFGRDILSRVMDACRRALSGGLFSVTLGSLLGIMLGLAASLSGRKTRELLMRFTDALAAFPTILMALMLAAALGRGLLPSVAAICIYMIPSFSRLTLSMADEARSRLYIKAAVSYNVPAGRLVLFHLLPPLLSRLLTQFTSSIGSAVLLESSLSFLGLGIQPPSSSLGMMLSEARNYILTHPYQAVPSGVVLMIMLLGFNLLGDGINNMFGDRHA